MKELQLYIVKDKNIIIRKQFELLDVPRSNLYYQPIGESELTHIAAKTLHFHLISTFFGLFS